MKKTLLCLTAFVWWTAVQARNVIYAGNIKSLQVVVNNDFLSPPVMKLHGGDVLHVAFDELSHEYHRFIYRIAHCAPDWSESNDIFESDYLKGFNGNPIEDYENSRGTTVDYTHYTLQIPNDKCRLTLSGNYRMSIYDEDNDMEKVMDIEFMVYEDAMKLGMEVTSNTDIDTHRGHQQVSLSLDYNGVRITDLEEQIFSVVRQNDREDNACINPRPTFIRGNGLDWKHQRDLIFDAGNEYRKYEVLALSHPTFGIDHIDWDGHCYNAFLFTAEPRRNYVYDEDANGAFYIRNSDNFENDITSDYVSVHYRMAMPPLENGRDIVVDGWWTTDGNRENYRMEYDEEDQAYYLTLMQKQGYYSYQYLERDDDGKTSNASFEGNFYQTENSYQAYVYYRNMGGRCWRLVAYRQQKVRF